jgi:hypothetical protein
MKRDAFQSFALILKNVGGVSYQKVLKSETLKCTHEEVLPQLDVKISVFISKSPLSRNDEGSNQ